jgi:hypothetical protein
MREPYPKEGSDKLAFVEPVTREATHGVVIVAC